MSATRIPKKIHFIYGLKPDFGGIPFNFAHWVAVRTAKRCNPDYEIHFWYEYKPENQYFRDLEDDIILHQVKAPESIFGNPIPHFAHRADVLRLQTLLEHGGIYLDVDTITVKPFDDLLPCEAFMARVKNAGRLYGLCNAIMGSAAGSVFLAAMLEAFRGFRSKGYDQYYDEIGSGFPLQIAQRMPEAVTVYDEHAFFVPDMTLTGLSQLFLETGDYPRAWCHHLWEKNAIKALQRFNERNFAAQPCTYTNYIKRMIPDDCKRLARNRATWCQKQLASGQARLSIRPRSPLDHDAINADPSPTAGADFTFDPGCEPWPFPNDCFKHVQVSRVLESLPDDGSHFFRELYRVSTNGCTIDIRTTHPRHDAFLQDPTFCLPWIAESFLALDRDRCVQAYFAGHEIAPLALDWGVDFELTRNELQSQNAPILSHLETLTSQNQLGVASLFNNVVNASNTSLRVRKERVVEGRSDS